MARLCFLCSSLCYLLLVTRISEGISNTDYYIYSTGSPHHTSEHSLDAQLLDIIDETHTHRKRDTTDHLDHSHEDAGAPITQVPIIANVTTNATVASQKNDTLKVPKLTQLKLNTTLRLAPLDDDTKLKNRGVKGTGQKKDYPPKTAQPPSIHVGVNGTGQRKGNVTILRDADIPVTIKPEDSYDADLPGEVDVNEDFINKTLSEHNITATKTDSHQYYNSTFSTKPEDGHFYWVNMSNQTNVKVNDLLSNSHRRAATVKLSFLFPFYGHLIKNVTIATGGFLYTGEYVHSWLAATQYIAPLMANFDTSLSNDSCIKYVDNGTAFTVQWEKVMLQDRPKDGQFTFQVTLLKNGDIVFVYQDVPLLIKDIKNVHHPVKIGLSDAYITDKTIFLVRRKTIYEYHRVNFAKEDIRNWTVIYLTALPTCLDNSDCESCLTATLQDFDCVWCSKVNKCSNGFDRHRQEWTDKGCDKQNLTKSATCHLISTEIYSYDHDSSLPDNNSVSKYYDLALEHHPPPDQLGVSGIMAILFLIVMVCGLSMWILYAYRNPHTTSGQILIRYRPSQWQWRRGEARYTAATIHM